MSCPCTGTRIIHAASLILKDTPTRLMAYQTSVMVMSCSTSISFFFSR